jgi:hypothetical protein
MFGKDVLRNFVIFFKNEYDGDLEVLTRSTEIPTDRSFIFIKIGNSNQKYDTIDNKNQIVNTPVCVEVNLYMENNPYTPDLKKIEGLLYSVNTIPVYDLTETPFVLTKKVLTIDRVSQPLYLSDGDYEKTTYIINIINAVGV